MFILWAFLIFFSLIILVIFSFPQFSPIPYFPSNRKDTKLILKALDLKNNQTIIDLGAGGGWVIFEAAKTAHQEKLNTQFIAVEINPILIVALHLKRLLHKNKRNIKIVRIDIFSCDYQKLVNPSARDSVNSLIFYLYVSPWFLPKIISQIKKSLKTFAAVTYFYKIKGEKYKQKITGINNLYLYDF